MRQLVVAVALLTAAPAGAMPLGWQGTVAIDGRAPAIARVGIRRTVDGVTIGRWACPKCPRRLCRAAFRVWCDEYGLPTADVGRRLPADGASCFGRLAGYLACGAPFLFADVDLREP
jgi:hypothetical protein